VVVLVAHHLSPAATSEERGSRQHSASRTVSAPAYVASSSGSRHGDRVGRARRAATSKQRGSKRSNWGGTLSLRFFYIVVFQL
jgi:hypothetical protein